MKKIRRSTVIVCVIIASVFILSKCADEEARTPASTTTPSETKVQPSSLSREQFAGSASCASCHKDIYEQHIRTGHFQTTRPASTKTIMGSFAAGKNKYSYNPSLHVTMEKRDSGLYQVVYFKGEEKKVLPIDMVIGSGTKGQSFMYWLNNRLFQLPITYFTIADQWANSPGFPSRVQFDRPITSRCLECHTTFTKVNSPAGAQLEEFDRDRMVLGVDCEKCHGPAADHVAYYSEKDSARNPAVINPARFSRQQKIDLCAVCHAGNIQKTQPSFSFVAGDTLTNYFKMDSLHPAAIESGEIDVHGNKLGVLKASKCFMRSEMTCNSCHSPHENEQGNLVLYSKRCMNCHKPGDAHFCKMDPKLVPGLTQNCIDCHMPVRQSRSIVLFTYDDEVPRAALFRSHFITIYREETKQFIDNKGNMKKLRNVR